MATQKVTRSDKRLTTFTFLRVQLFFSSPGLIPVPHQFISSALAFGMASSSDLLVIFKDLTANCEKVNWSISSRKTDSECVVTSEKVFKLLDLEDQDTALLLLKARFSQVENCLSALKSNLMSVQPGCHQRLFCQRR